MVAFLKQRGGKWKCVGSKEAKRRLAEALKKEENHWNSLTPEQQQEKRGMYAASALKLKRVVAARRESLKVDPRFYRTPIDC